MSAARAVFGSNAPTILGCAVTLLLSSSFATEIDAQEPATGRLEGVVTDSLQSAPLSGGVVTATRLEPLPATTEMVLTDKQGRYVFERVPAGRYAVTLASPLLDSLEFGGVPMVTTIRAGETVRADLAVPSRETLRTLACPGAGLARWTGALLGVVTDMETRKPLVGAELNVTWREFAIDTAKQEIGAKMRVARTTTNASGEYRMCGLPTDESLDVQISYQGVPGRVRPLTVNDDVGVLVRNLLFRVRSNDAVVDPAVAVPAIELPPTAGHASLAGRITRAGGEPIAGAQLRVVNTPVSGRSDEQGQFMLTGLPAGTQELEVRHLGYNEVRRSLELKDGQTVRENVSLDRVVSLDSVRIVAHRVTYPEFERNRLQFRRGTFMDADEIARRGRRTLPQLLTSTGDFTMLPMSRGRLGVMSTHLRRCYETQAGAERLDPLNLVVDNMEHMEISDVFYPIVEAVEIYSEPEQAPLKYARACSVVVVWTKWSAKHPKGAPREAPREP